MTRIDVDRNDLSRTRITDDERAPLAEGDIRVAIEAFALTANNISYGVVGEKIGYWKFFPAEGPWGVIPVWGVGVVKESRHDALGVGERLYGYFPMGASLDMTPAKVSDRRFLDGAAHRADLPPVYNGYLRLDAEPGYDPETDNARMALYPLYATAFCLYDFFKDNDWFGAARILVLSASSKTAIGCALAFGEDDGAPEIVGLTSRGNLDWVRDLGIYSQAFDYDDLGAIAADTPTAIIDMSGNGPLLGALHKRLGDHMRYTSNVGLTHWSENAMGPDFIRERSAMFFAPGHMRKRASDWGPGVFEEKSFAFFRRAAARSGSILRYETISGLEAAHGAYQRLLAGTIRPDCALIVRP